MPPVSFKAANQAALGQLADLLQSWLPGGRFEGNEYVALNPTRNDRHLGSFKINVRTGKWADFATGDKGGDIVSLLAYLQGSSQIEGAQKLSEILGSRHGDSVQE